MKAEMDYREKWGPEYPCKRKAGQPATYGGSTVIQSVIAKAYAERGWIENAPEEKFADRGPRSTVADAKREKVYEKRWRQMQFWMAQKNVYTIQQVAENMGFTGRDVLRDFVRNHGERMARLYGKLPYMYGRKGHELSPIWTRCMEAKA
jgi:hypothetical protein